LYSSAPASNHCSHEPPLMFFLLLFLVFGAFRFLGIGRLSIFDENLHLGCPFRYTKFRWKT
jgi:hypothetical protein